MPESDTRSFSCSPEIHRTYAPWLVGQGVPLFMYLVIIVTQPCDVLETALKTVKPYSSMGDNYYRCSFYPLTLLKQLSKPAALPYIISWGGPSNLIPISQTRRRKRKQPAQVIPSMRDGVSRASKRNSLSTTLQPSLLSCLSLTEARILYTDSGIMPEAS